LTPRRFTETVTSTETPDKTVVGTETETTVAGGKLFAYVVADPPENATVVAYSDPRVDNSTLLRTVLNRAVEDEDGTAVTNINAEERMALNEDLSDVPLYQGDESGYYIRYRNKTIQVIVATFA
jgi:hypothetical protein